MEENFHTHVSEYFQDTDIYSDSYDSVEDSRILADVEQAVRLKNPEMLEKSALILIEKYQNNANVSHMYIRYLFTTLFRYLFQVLPYESQHNLEKAVNEIYSLQRFENIKEHLKTYLTQALEQIQADAQAPKHSIQIVKQYIHAHYMEDLSLDQLSDVVYLNPKYLSNIFSQTTGISFNKYIRNVRMDKAKELLLHTNMKVSDISTSIGYPNSSYFCKVFLKEYGQSPEKYRQNKGRLL